MIPYIWANYDNYNALNNRELLVIPATDLYTYKFAGSQAVDHRKGNYLSFECNNPTGSDLNIKVVFYDSSNIGVKSEYFFRVRPGDNRYLIRISEDYFWDVFNIDTVIFEANENYTIGDLRVLEGD